MATHVQFSMELPIYLVGMGQVHMNPVRIGRVSIFGMRMCRLRVCGVRMCRVGGMNDAHYQSLFILYKQDSDLIIENKSEPPWLHNFFVSTLATQLTNKAQTLIYNTLGSKKDW